MKSKTKKKNILRKDISVIYVCNKNVLDRKLNDLVMKHDVLYEINENDIRINWLENEKNLRTNRENVEFSKPIAIIFGRIISITKLFVIFSAFIGKNQKNPYMKIT